MAGGRLTGVIVGAGKMAKTVVVEVSRIVKHSKYPRFLRRTSKHKAHDEAGVLVEGDKVLPDAHCLCVWMISAIVGL